MITVDDWTVSPVLRCPWCGKMAYIDAETFTGSLKCGGRGGCGKHWWATRIQGDVRAQLLEDFEGDETLVESFVAAFNLPASAPAEGAFWQIRLAGRESYRYHTYPGAGRSIALLRNVLALLRPAS